MDLPNGFRNFQVPDSSPASKSLIVQEFLVFLLILAICCIYFVIATFDADIWCKRRILKWWGRRVPTDSESQIQNFDVDGGEEVDEAEEEEEDFRSTTDLIMETPL